MAPKVKGFVHPYFKVYVCNTLILRPFGAHEVCHWVVYTYASFLVQGLCEYMICAQSSSLLVEDLHQT